MRPASISERIRADCAHHRSAEYKKQRALRHFPAEPEWGVFDQTAFGQRMLLLDIQEAMDALPDFHEDPDPEEEELDGVLDIRQ